MAKLDFRRAAFPCAALQDNVDNRANLLVLLKQYLKAEIDSSLPADERMNFAELVKQALVLLELDDDTFANYVSVSRPTVGRWCRGETEPLTAGRAAVCFEIYDCVNDRLRLLNGFAKKGYAADFQAA
ncbi:hypothetical protein K3555_13655 [Leisingera sp. M527]|uniref:hypothetical protein n=1 Tax=Leisingera sp. M527 TaxID=2867014 RepID=UPI0021A71241|nr:hypothetical protein [Leisingera sp. M527]UWQ31638.1 hypothetical protein K3555_13655 [Leisingera sp. M527]